MKRAEGVLSYDSVKGGFVDPADPTTIVNQDQIKAYLLTLVKQWQESALRYRLHY